MRKHIETQIRTYEEADKALMKIGECERAIERIEIEMQETISRAREAASVQATPWKAVLKEQAAALGAFAESRKEDFEKVRTRQLNHGSLGFRRSTRIVLPRSEGRLREILHKLKQKGMQECILETLPRIDKEQLKKYTAEEILSVGAGVETPDVFWYECNREEVQG